MSRPFTALLLVLAIGCGADPVVETVAPDDGGFVLPDVPADVPDPPDVLSDTVEEVSDVPPEVGDVLDEDPGPELPGEIPIGGPDPGPPIGDGNIGEPCFLDNHCDNDGLCLDWPDGYCTQLNCPVVGQCSEGSACVDQGGGTTVCLATCDSQADCREGYGCKPFSDVDGNLTQGCYALDPEAAPAGGACEEHHQCEGPFSCLTFVPEGYCALLACGDDAPCPDGTTCVAYNGHPTCLRACAETEDCLVGGAIERICGPLLDHKSKVAYVCIPAVPGVSVGEGCTTDIECESNECAIVAEGKCVSSNLGCFTGEDCPGAGLCELAPAYVKGLCTQACGQDVACPGNTVCIATWKAPAFCKSPCAKIGDNIACQKPLGESCVFGDTIASTTGSGKYACAVLKGGDPGMPCTEDEGCKEGGCLLGGDEGVCAPDCSQTLSCPFPTSCVEHLGALRCMKRCFSVQDCPGSLKCQATPTSPAKICI